MSRWFLFFIAIGLGAALGLFYGWVLNPVKLVDVTPDSLHFSYKIDYVLMVAEAYSHWLTMTEPHWGNVQYSPVNYQDLSYYSAPKKKPTLKSLDEVDPELLEVYKKLGISLDELKKINRRCS